MESTADTSSTAGFSSRSFSVSSPSPPERNGGKKNPVEELPGKAAKNRVGKGDPRGDTSRIFQQQFNKVKGELNKQR